MIDSTRQLPLSLPHDPALSREDFLVGSANRAAIGLIERFPDWPNRIALLVGPPGSGKTHLAAIWREASGAAAVAGATLAAGDVDRLLAGSGAVIVEDIDDPATDPAALFHLINRTRETGGSALLTSRVPIAGLPYSLADLESRLRAAVPATLSEPDDELLSRVMLKLFADRQIQVDIGVVDFLSRRMDRSLDAARRLVEALDHAALAAGRPITRQLAAAVLALAAGTEAEEDG